MTIVNFLLGLIFIAGVSFVFLFPYILLLRWIYRGGLGRFVSSLRWARNYICVLLVIIGFITLPLSIKRADYYIRSTNIRSKMRVVIQGLEKYQGKEPWDDEEFGWFVDDWAYLETGAGSYIWIQVRYVMPAGLHDTIADAYYFAPGLTSLGSQIEDSFPETSFWVLSVGPNLGPTKANNKKIPVVPSDYLAFKFETGKYEWEKLTMLGRDKALGESLLLTWALMTGPQVHYPFSDKEIMLLPWYEKVNWYMVWGAFQRWVMWGA